MTTALKPYSTVKDSGVDWLGSVPDRWELLPGRACFLERKESNVGLKEATVLSLSYGRIVVKPPEKLHGLVPASFETYQIVDPGNIVVRPTDLQNDRHSLRFGINRNRGIITSAYLCFVATKRLTPEYGHLLLHSYDLMKVFYGLGSGLRQNLDWTDFKYLPCVVPPLAEQAAIAGFLDHMDRRIQEYIRAKEKLIALLKEYKQALIHQAVTGQIDVRTGKPYPEYKESGVEWLERTPKHWKILRFANICSKIRNGYVGPTRNIFVSDGVKYLQSLHIKDNRIQFDGTYFVRESWSHAHPRSVLREGDVLIVQTGDIGQVAVVPKEFEGSNCHALIVCTCRADIAIGQYVSMVLNSTYGFNSLMQIKTGALHPHLNCTFVREIYLPIPPVDEQVCIWTKVNDQINRFERVLKNMEASLLYSVTFAHVLSPMLSPESLISEKQPLTFRSSAPSPTMKLVIW